MKKKWTALALSGFLLCSMGTPALAAGNQPASRAAKHTELERIQPLPESQLYYGEVKEILTGENGDITGLYMDSARSGEYVMNLSDETFWIDSGRRAASSPSGITVGERLYVFHSAASTRSLPPQSSAFAVVHNVPQDIGCAMYHKAEATEEQDGMLRITTDNGGLFLYAGQETALSTYTGSRIDGLDGIKTGTYFMAWYDAVALSYPGQAYAQHIMVLDRESAAEPLSRSALVGLLHDAQGNPVVNYAMNYTDVDQSAPYGEALRWASSEHIISGYGDGRVGPGDAVTREQMAVMIWRWAGSPMLMDYPGLSNYSDVEEISRFAQPALAWAHQRGLFPTSGRLGPKDTVFQAEAEAILTALQEQTPKAT